MPGESPPAAGEVVWIRKRRWRVEHLRLAGRAGAIDAVSTSDAGVRRTFLTPIDQTWSEGGRDRLRHVRWARARARLLATAARAGGLRLPLSAIDAAVDVLPFQLEAALAFVRGARRVLLADAVGLGKTIQAGLVIAEILRRTTDAWVLVLVPAPLRDQWALELAERFTIGAAHADADGLRRLAADAPRGGSPWRAGVWIASADFLKQPHVFDALPLRPWDLIVIDEAHDAAGESDRHAACDALARRSRRVLLLTATPHNGDPAAFDRLCRLGRWPPRPSADDRLTILRRTPASLGWLSDRRVRWHRVTPSAAERATLDALLAFEAAILRAAGDQRHGAAVLLLSVFRKRALSTMAALAVSLGRRAAWLDGTAALDADTGWQQPRLDFGEMTGDALTREDDVALAADVGLDRTRERAWIRRLSALAERAAADESRVRRVTALLTRAREPVVIFTEFRDSLTALARRLERHRAVSLLHGGQSVAERRAALSAYLEGPATVLVATDVAGQGLNLQTRGRWVVNFDLPWNPARLAQRAGRVDRIGQARPVHVTLLSSRHVAEADFIRRLSHRAVRAGDALDFDVGDICASERAVGAAVMAGADVEPVGAPPVMALDVTWRRQAFWTARDIVRRRLWAARWREPDEPTVRPMASRARASRRGASAPMWILVYATPIVDAAGAVLETDLSAWRVWTTGRGAPARPVVDLMRQRAASRAARRVARVRHWLEPLQRDAAGREAALAREMTRVRVGERPQPGLFDRPPTAGTSHDGPAGDQAAWPVAVAAGPSALVAALAMDR